MPSRILRESFVTSESVASMPPACQDRLPRYFLLADDYGCFLVHAAVIRGRIFPLRPDVTEQIVDADLAEFARAGVVQLYTGQDGKRYGAFPGWDTHQRPPREVTKRKYPAPPPVSLLPGNARKFPAESLEGGNGAPKEGELPSLCPAVPGSAGKFPEFPTSSSSSSSSSIAIARSPHSPPRGADGLGVVRLRKRKRGQTTLAEDLRADRDRVRNERSKLLHEWLLNNRNATRDAQLAWVQDRCGASPPEAEDVIALVGNALSQAGVRNGHE